MRLVKPSKAAGFHKYLYTALKTRPAGYQSYFRHGRLDPIQCSSFNAYRDSVLLIAISSAESTWYAFLSWTVICQTVRADSKCLGNITAVFSVVLFNLLPLVLVSFDLKKSAAKYGYHQYLVQRTSTFLVFLESSFIISLMICQKLKSIPFLWPDHFLSWFSFGYVTRVDMKCSFHLFPRDESITFVKILEETTVVETVNFQFTPSI